MLDLGSSRSRIECAESECVWVVNSAKYVRDHVDWKICFKC